MRIDRARRVSSRQGAKTMRETIFLVLGLAAGCQTAGEPAEPTFQAGTVLARVTLSDSYRVEFVQVEPGMIGIHEAASVDDTMIPLRGSLTEMHQALAPGQPVPAALVEADLSYVPRSDPPEGVTPRSIDYYDDEYGAQWFLDRYCKGGESRKCFTNQVQREKRVRADWYKSCVMAGDFDLAAEIRITSGYDTPDWATIYDPSYSTKLLEERVPPREVRCGTYSISWPYGNKTFLSHGIPPIAEISWPGGEGIPDQDDVGHIHFVAAWKDRGVFGKAGQ
jgi:hypothetical protein